MKLVCTLLMVEDMAVSKAFYQGLMNQAVAMDLGANVVFQSGLGLQADYKTHLDIDPAGVKRYSNTCELYFEEDALDELILRLKENKVRFYHELREQPWGQRVTRFYDPDGHLIEVGEPMELVIRRFLEQGLSPQETAARTMYPLEFVHRCMQP